MIYVDEKYQDSNLYQWPDRDVDPKNKKKEYCRKNCEAIYSTHIRNKSGIPADIVSEWEELRLYGKGLQDPNQYIKTLTGGEKATQSSVLDVVSADSSVYNTKLERRKAWNNVNKQVISLAPKIKDHFYGMFKKQEYDVTANTIDEDSGALMEDMKFRLLANSIFQKELTLLRQNAGIPQPQQDFLPKDITELELFESSGGFKLNVAMDMEKILKHTFHISDWDNTMKRKLIDDAVDIGYIAGEEYIDEDTGKTKTAYVDICNLAIQYSTRFDFEDSEWEGYMDFVPVSKLRQKGFTKEFLEEQIGNYAGKFGNADYVSGDNGGLGFNTHTYDAFKIPVYTCYWIDMDAEYQEMYKDSKGRKKIKDVKYGKKTTSENKEIRVKKDRKIYTAKWIVGSEEVYDEGPAFNQTFKDEKPILPIRVVKLTENSITKRLKPIYDDMQIAWLKYQNAQVMAMNAGYAINVRLLNNIKLGGKKLSLKEVFDIMKDTGNVFYSDTMHMGKYEGGAVNPVTPLPGGMGTQLTEAITKFEWSIRMIEHETGLTSLSMGATPNPEAGKATTELSMAATQNVIRPIIDAVMVLKGRLAENAMLRAQLLIRTSERSRKAYTRVIGRKGVEALKTAEGRAVSYGIDLEPRPTDDERRRLEVLVEEAISLGRDGVTSIELPDAMMIYRQLDNGANIKEVEIKLAYKIRKYKEAKQQEAAQAMQIQSQEVMKQNQQKQQADAASKQQDNQAEAGKLKLEHGLNMQTENFNANKEFKLKIMELADKEKDRDSKEKIAKMSKTEAE